MGGGMRDRVLRGSEEEREKALRGGGLRGGEGPKGGEAGGGGREVDKVVRGRLDENKGFGGRGCKGRGPAWSWRHLGGRRGPAGGRFRVGPLHKSLTKRTHWRRFGKMPVALTQIVCIILQQTILIPTFSSSCLESNLLYPSCSSGRCQMGASGLCRGCIAARLG